MSSEGSYLCEVSGEAPLFQTAKMQNFLKVVGKLHFCNETDDGIWMTSIIMWKVSSDIELMIDYQIYAN